MFTTLRAGLGLIRDRLSPLMPGLHAVLAVALVARYLHGLIPWPSLARAISEVFIAVVLGLYLRNAIHFSARFEPGIRFALQRILRLGIILLGLRLSLQDVVGTGLSALLLILVCVAAALTLAALMGRLFRIPLRLAVLIGVGTTICGNSAIVATAPVIEAKDEEVSLAVATITFYGTLAVILYPIVGLLLGLTNEAFGMWAGTAVPDTSQVVATGAAFSEGARDVATVVKLVRNTLMAPLILAIGVLFARMQRSHTNTRAARMSPGKIVPWFVVGFLAMTALRTAGVAAGFLPQDVADPGRLAGAAAVLKALDEVAKLAILMALSAIGLSTDAVALRKTGLKPILLGIGVAGCLSLISLALIRWVLN